AAEPESAQAVKQQGSASIQAVAAAKALAKEAKPAEPVAKTSATPSSIATVAAPAPSAAIAPPAVVDKPPEDREIAAKAAEAAIVAPPAVIERPPEDREIAAKAAIAPTPSDTTSAQDPVATPTPKPVVVEPPAEIARTQEPVAVAPKPVVVAPPAETARAPVAEAAAEVMRVQEPIAVAPKPVVVAPPAETARTQEPVNAAPEPVAVEPKPVVVEPPAPKAVEAPTPADTAPVVERRPAATTPAAAAAEDASGLAQEGGPIPDPTPSQRPVVDLDHTSAPEAGLAERPAAPAEADGKPIRSAYVPAARFAPTVEAHAAPAFGKRLPDGADASGYERLPVSAEPPRARTIDLRAPEIRVGSGTWKREESRAAMTDPKAYYAKLVIPTPGLSGTTAYEFKARATGSGWVGFGLHVHGRGAWRLTGYGGGDSLLVWVTSDPKAYGDAAPRLQVYRSRGEVAMDLLAEARLVGSAFEDAAYRVEYDPAAGSVRAYVNGSLTLSASGIANPAPFEYAALRALDTAEFSDLTIQDASTGAAPTEKTP
ncbi:MAG TPA: hypothetical protein PLE25_03015, partial [Spirochaetales bacterium]|nr:hypothetical protein [Spirochaetales bacterium]